MKTQGLLKVGTLVRGLTPTQFKKIMNRINKKHWLIKGRCVKYVDTSFDFRDHTFWRVVIRPFGERKEFNTSLVYDKQTKTINKFGGNTKHDNLYDEIIEWLAEVEK